MQVLKDREGERPAPKGGKKQPITVPILIYIIE
jgi:hypothetical protein